MSDKDSVINGLDEIMRYDGEQMFYNDIFIRGIAEDAIAMLKKDVRTANISSQRTNLVNIMGCTYR